MSNKVEYAIHGDQVLMSVEVPGESVVAREDGMVTITMEDVVWRQTARNVLRESNAAERRLPPEAVVARVRDALGDAAKQASQVPDAAVARLRLASTVLHRIADMVQAGTICDVEISWVRNATHLINVAFQTENRRAEFTIELGRGVISEVTCGCPTSLLDDDGWPLHEDRCPMRVVEIER